MSPTKYRLLLTASCALILADCASVDINLPSITESETGERLQGKIVWHDLLTNDPAASKRFYGELFAWEFESVGHAAGLDAASAYTLIRHNGRLIGGMIDTKALNNRTDISQWVVVISVDDVDAAVKRFVHGGGEVLTPPKDLQRRGRIAVVQDPAGALLALLQTRDGDPFDRQPEYGDFLWNELWTRDVNGATTFYSDAIGYAAADWAGASDAEAPANYRLLKQGDTPRAGILANPFEELDPVWVSYRRVLWQSPYGYEYFGWR